MYCEVVKMVVDDMARWLPGTRGWGSWRPGPSCPAPSTGPGRTPRTPTAASGSHHINIPQLHTLRLYQEYEVVET